MVHASQTETTQFEFEMIDNTKCYECQSSAIEYTTSATGGKVPHGLCRRCHEMLSARKRSGGGGVSIRTQDMKENVYETKYGTD